MELFGRMLARSSLTILYARASHEDVARNLFILTENDCSGRFEVCPKARFLDHHDGERGEELGDEVRRARVDRGRRARELGAWRAGRSSQA